MNANRDERRGVLSVLTLLVLSLAGCAAQTQAPSATPRRSPGGGEGPAGQSFERDANPMLAAARENRINLFGEIEGGPETQYFSRSAAAMRRHSFSDVGADSDPDLDSTGGRIVYASTCHNNRPDLYIKTVTGVAVTQLTSDPASDIQPQWNPNDSLVAFASDRAGTWDIWITGIDGGQAVQVTSGGAQDVHPSWSPDGSQLVFSRLPANGGQWELWVVDATAGGQQRFIGYGLFPEWSPTGSTIVFQRARERGSRWFGIWTLTLVDGEPRHPTEVAASAHQAMILPTFSPDGNQIAFAATNGTVDRPASRAAAAGEAGRTEAPGSADGAPVAVTGPSQPVFDIWVMNADGSGKVRLTDGFSSNFAPAFSPEGRIFYTSGRAGQANVWSQQLTVPGMFEGGQGTVAADGGLPAGDRPVSNTTRPTAALNIIEPTQSEEE